MASTNHNGDSSRNADARPAQGASTNGDGSQTPTSPSTAWVGDNMAQALRDLARGEQTATALEASLTNLETKLDEILASFGVLREETAGTKSGSGEVNGKKDEASKN